MDRSFDLVALLKQQPITKTHKSRPSQFVSVAGGVQKRLETNIKNRKSSRLSIFDRIRNISKCESPQPPPLSEVQLKAEHRKQQLEKWKQEKEKKKKEAAAQKKKPFVAGVAHKTTFGPPPPPRALPSTSGRVTRSQASKQRSEQTNKQESFAPCNAAFKPPQFKNMKVPTLAPVTKKKTNKFKPTVTFEPVLPKTTQNLRATRSKTALNKPNFTDNKATYKPNDNTKGKHKNQSSKPPLLKQHMFQSSSSSDIEKPVKKTSKLQPKTFQSTSSSSMERDTKKSYPKSQPRKSLSHSSSSDNEKPVKRTSKIQPKVFQSSSASSMEQDQPASQSSSCSDIAKPNKKTVKLQPKTVKSSSSSEQESRDVAIMGLRTSFRDLTSTGIQFPAKMATLPTSSVSPDSEPTSMSVDVSTPRNVIPRSESSSEEKLRSPKSGASLTPEQIIEEAKNISPCVTMSRGKDNARKEMKKKLDAGLLDEDISNMDSVNHFRRQLDSEITRITSMCEAWDKIFAQTVLPEAIQELVLTAVGQARLLVSQKMQQFAGLVERCARPAPGAALVTPADLHGFWDMVFMQVENVDMRFKKLEELRAREWEDEPKAAPARRPAVRRANSSAGAARPAAGPSRLRDMIAAARRAKKEQESQSSEQSESDKSESTPPECKTFEAGFFSVSSPLKKPASGPATPANKPSLLKTVLSSEARKASASKSSTSFAMLRASLMSKNVDIEGVSPLMQTPTMSPVNLYATPARSILKQTNPISSKKPEKLKMVLFHEEGSPGSYASCEPAPEEVKEVAELEKENKPTSRRRSRLSRQNAQDQPSPVMTRSRRKSAQTPLLASDSNSERRSARSKARNDAQETPKRSSRRRKSAAVV